MEDYRHWTTLPPRLGSTDLRSIGSFETETVAGEIRTEPKGWNISQLASPVVEGERGDNLHDDGYIEYVCSGTHSPDHLISLGDRSASYSVTDVECTHVDGAFNSAPDTPSTIYPDRLIRPLPRRTLRSRLSSDAADTIFYPPTPPASQIFYGVSADSEEAVNESKVYVQQTVETELSPEVDAHNFETSVELESGDEDGPVVVRRNGVRRSSLSPSVSSNHPNFPNVDAPQAKSSSSGPDGYDAFENTNNKKKRKIPTPGNLGGHHSALSPEFASMGLANSTPAPPPAPSDSTGTYYGSGNPASPLGSGISGSGRGRLGRPVVRSSSRTPLSANAQNGWMHTRTPSRRDGLMSSPGPSGMCFSRMLFPNLGTFTNFLQANRLTKGLSPLPSRTQHFRPHRGVPATSVCWTRKTPPQSKLNLHLHASPIPLKAWPCKELTQSLIDLPLRLLVTRIRSSEGFPHKEHRLARVWVHP
jgi:hypothetical protein